MYDPTAENAQQGQTDVRLRWVWGFAIIRGMEKTRPILYGVSDYAEIRKANAWFIDRTAKIRDIEVMRYSLFLRPRRFGKSLLLSILEAYYDVRYADRFDFFFAGTDIGANPTDERGKYLILKFDFSAVSKTPSRVQDDFNGYAGLRCDTFARDYGKLLPEGLAERIFKAQTAGMKLNEIASGLQHTDLKLYVIIDEYDSFTNTILAEHGQAEYDALCHGDGFFKDFFTRLKAATSGTDAPVTLIEMKYVKAGDPAPTPHELADIKAKAIEQLNQYSTAPALVKEWRLTPQPPNRPTTQPPNQSSVALHRLVLVFHGGDCVLAEEAK